MGLTPYAAEACKQSNIAGMVDQAARSYGQHVARSIPAQCAVSRVQHLPRTEKQLSALADRYMRQRYWLKPADHRLLATASELSMRRSSKVALRALPFLVWCLLNLVSCKPLEGEREVAVLRLGALPCVLVGTRTMHQTVLPSHDMTRESCLMHPWQLQQWTKLI